MLAKYLDTKTYCPPGGYDISWSLRDKLYCLQLYLRARDAGYDSEQMAWSLAIMTTEDMIRSSHCNSGVEMEFSDVWQRRIHAFKKMVAS
jgi:hypothetical protein